MKVRNCRVCDDELPASRYFKCHKCQPILSSISDEYIYHTGDEGVDDFTENMADGLFDNMSLDDAYGEEISEEAENEGEFYDEDYSSEEGEREWDDTD